MKKSRARSNRVAAVTVAGLTGTTLVAAQDTEQPQLQQATSNQVIEEVVAVGRLRSTAFDVVGERLEREVVTDFLSVEQFTRTGDTSVSLALRRVPGLTLVNDKFIYVRGLGERYSSTLLNGAFVPSPDLTRNVIPLDIFPTNILQALEVQKGYTPDLPAAFGGGNIQIVTRSIPQGPVFQAQVTSGYNGQSGGDGWTYPGGGDDSLGTDDGTRALPAEIRNAINTFRGSLSPVAIFNTLNQSGAPASFADAQAINRDLALSLNRNIDLQPKSLGPDGGFQASAGNRWFFGDAEEWEFGVMGLASYSNTWRNRDLTTRSVADPDEQFFKTERTINEVNLTTALNLGLQFTADHEINTSSFVLRNTEDEASLRRGHDLNYLRADGLQRREYQTRFEERELTTHQIRGSHTLGDDTLDRFEFLDNDLFRGMTFDWYYSDSTAMTDIPNETAITGIDRIDPDTGELFSTAVFRGVGTAAFRFTDLQDEVDSHGWDLSQNFAVGDAQVELSVGQDVSSKGRQYLLTQLFMGTDNLDALAGTPGQVFSDSNILDPANGLELTLSGLATESYVAGQTLDGSYFMADALLGDAWRIVGGVRYEQFVQTALPIDQYEFDVALGQVPGLPTDSADAAAAFLDNIVFREDDIYPALAATYSRPGFWAEEFQLRVGVSQTTTRPDLREISPSLFIDPLTEIRIVGNPTLVTSPIDSFDVRAEWFFDSGDNFTVSFFYKEIDTPIETIQSAGSDDDIVLTFVNAESAEITGVEIEWLKDLSFLGDSWGDWIEQFFIGGNVTLSDSEITMGAAGSALTNNVRPMSQQSEVIANVQLGFDSDNGNHSWSLVYNTFSERVFFAGRNGIPDAYEQPFDSLDFIYQYYPTDRLQMRFRFQNLLDEVTEITRGDVAVLEQDFGTSFRFDLQWNLN
jgi:TonB-dependent receptor